MPYSLNAEADDWARGTLRWHNPPAILREDVWPGETQAGQGALSPLRLIFRPHGYRSTGPADDPCLDSAATKSWGGIMTVDVPRSLPRSPMVYFDIRAKATGGILHLDFGWINENIDGDGAGDNEDQSQPPNDYIDYDPSEGINEDTGLDTLLDAEEVGRCGSAYNAETNPDPAGDDWWFEGEGKGAGADNRRPPVPLEVWQNSEYQTRVDDANDWLHYEWINGTEGNINDQAVQGLPDREDLASNGLNIVDAYFEFTVPLQADSTNPYVVAGSEYNGWHTYRLSIDWPVQYDVVKSHPALEVAWKYFTHMRVWLEQPGYAADSLADMDSVWIADWRFVGGSLH